MNANTTLSRPIPGIAMIVFGLFLFSIQDVIIKYFSGTYPVLELVFIRSVTGLIIILTGLAVLGKTQSIKLHGKQAVLIKGGLGFISYICYYLALASLPMAETATITFFAPVIVTGLSAILFKEKVGIHRWSAVCLGFFSIVLVIGPKGHFGNPAIVLALLAAISYAGMTLYTRFMDPRDSAITSAFYTTLVFLVMSLLFTIVIYFLDFDNDSSHRSLEFLVRTWEKPSDFHQWLIISTALIAAVGFYCLTQAYILADFSVVAPFEYTYLLWSVLFGYLFWNELPQTQSGFGILLLILSNLYILRRETILRKRKDLP
ncbi:MAG: EamA family transporter [Gammaproteobacteria bacterium]|nr:EamA family transporter [Gammaproteobacteria bacterium]